MKMRSILSAVILATMITGCATYGNKTVDDPKKFLNIREGKSTKQDIYAVFGQPHDVDYAQDKAQSLWIYFKVESSPTAWSYIPYVGLLAGGTNEETTKVYFFFNSEGKLIKTQTNKKSDSENQWAGMARIASQGNRDDRSAHVEREMMKIGKPFDKKAAHRVKFVR